MNAQRSRLVLDAEDNIENLKRLENGFWAGGFTPEPSECGDAGAVVPPEWIEEVRSVLEDHGLWMEERSRDAAVGGDDARDPHASEPEGGGEGQAQGLPGADTVMIRRSLRSGQSVSFDGNIVIMGDVNPGSEVCATGDIVVFGCLRGVAYAGANGKQDARVVALRLMPTQLRIADRIARSPDGEVQAPLSPEAAFLRDGAIVIEPWTTH